MSDLTLAPSTLHTLAAIDYEEAAKMHRKAAAYHERGRLSEAKASASIIALRHDRMDRTSSAACDATAKMYSDNATPNNAQPVRTRPAPILSSDVPEAPARGRAGYAPLRVGSTKAAPPPG